VRSPRWNHRHSFSHSIPLFFSSCDAPLYLITSSFIIINHHHHPLAMALSKALFVHYGLSPQTQSPRLLFNHNSQQQQQDRSSNIPTQQGLSSSSSSSSTLLRRWGAGMNGVNAKLPLASTSILRNTRGRNGRVVVFAVAAGVPVQSPDGERSPNPKSAAVIQKDDESPKSASLNGGAVSTETTVSITVVGASGDLAKKKNLSCFVCSLLRRLFT